MFVDILPLLKKIHVQFVALISLTLINFMISSANLKSSYDEHGYVVCENLLPDSVIEELRRVIDQVVSDGLSLKRSNDIYEILEDIETSEPRIERINSPHTIDSVFNSLIRRQEITNVLQELLGPNVRIQNSKLNLKLPG